jgi:MoxR-like ATPase
MATSTGSLLSRDELAPSVEVARRVLNQLDAMLLGRPELHRLVFAAILARGHLLLEGVPGVGKTALVKALGELLGLDFKRAQFTPDLMPGDILGTHILQENAAGGREMVFRPGPIFTNLLLADEINRASPKTQSALLEAMQERCVTLMGTTRPLPDPFFVLASQNPIELEGTYPLPEAQLDRFLFKLIVPPPDAETLDRIISTRRHGTPPAAPAGVALHRPVGGRDPSHMRRRDIPGADLRQPRGFAACGHCPGRIVTGHRPLEWPTDGGV